MSKILKNLGQLPRGTLLVLMLIPLFASCEPVINIFSFFPDTNYTVSRDMLPPYIKPVTLKTEDGVALEALYFSHKTRSGKIVVYFHGNAENLYYRIDEGNMIYGMGYDCIISGYRGYGGSTGSPSESGIYIDGRTVLGYVTGSLKYKPEQTFILGRSLGTAVAVETAQNFNPAGVILVTPFTSAADMVREICPDIFASAAGNSFNSIDKIGNLRCPLLVIHGTEDRVVPYSLGLKLFRAYPGKGKFVTINGAGHNDLEYVDPELYWDSMKTFLVGK